MTLTPSSPLLRTLFAALACATAISAAPPALAQSTVGLNSGYTAFRSESFFLLADTQFGPEDTAQVRVELPASSRYALSDYGGIDIVLYRVPQPLEFLRAQKNLHRIDIRARPSDGGLSNTLSYLWDNAWKKSRLAWRDVFSSDTRAEVVNTVPALRTDETINQRTQFTPQRQFKPLAGFEVVDHFRYPVWDAQPIQPPQDVLLSGSSSNFILAPEGNVYVPLGKLEPGLYLVEGLLGTHRALTMVFVSRAVAVTKSSAEALMVWTADRSSGAALGGSKLLWSDGAGVLQSATTDSNGLATLNHASPEHTWLLGEDSGGGVFVSENFYYDSEIYNTKLYITTDRPLYRPGDEVQLKFVGRTFVSSSQSQPMEAGTLGVEVYDPNGTPVLSTSVPLDAVSGADTGFRLPANATAGGYEIRASYQGDAYGAAFRVAEYVKPHFKIDITPDQAHFKTGEPVSGKIQLSYPDGKPVSHASVDLTLRAQTLTMVQGEMQYSGMFPVQLETAVLNTDSDGNVRFTLPPVKEPSRLIVSVLATDGAAYRVRSTREILVERAAASWKLQADRRFATPDQPAAFTLVADAEHPAPPVQWEIIRLEDQRRQQGEFDPAQTVWRPGINEPGSYSLLLRDANGDLVAATAHWVSGNGVQAVPGTIEMVTDRDSYQPGDTARILITFSEAVDEALFTLEGDRVEASALASRSGGWLNSQRIAPNQWQVELPVQQHFAPNITFSTVYVKHGDYVFQNVGIVIPPPSLQVSITTDRQSVAPGETVTVRLQTTLNGQPAPAMLAVAVVDEMIYALQPEIAPDIVDFFFHPRRNNVRTGASTSFIAYDQALDYAADALQNAPARSQYQERGIKVQERPRRDDRDTASWQPKLQTDANGQASFSFIMPDALTRWRITARAIGNGGSADGIPGQHHQWVHSDKDFYAKWTAPVWRRAGDAPEVPLALFNHTADAQTVEVELSVGPQTLQQTVTLQRGINYASFLLPDVSGDSDARVTVRHDGKVVDQLDTRLTSRPLAWSGPQQQLIPVSAYRPTEISLPPSARHLRLRLTNSSADQFLRIANDLLDYPWGCVEQTASRLIPLALATPLLGGQSVSDGHSGRLWQMLYSQRLRLAALAGPNAVFGWWGNTTGDSALMTSYAYFADWYASRTLHLQLPPEHWQHVLTVYQKHAHEEPLLHQALALWFIQQMGLPVRTQAGGLIDALGRASSGTDAGALENGQSPLLTQPDSALGQAYARVLTAEIAREAGITPASHFDATLADAHALLATSGQPSAQALLILNGVSSSADAENILAHISTSMPTLDRALTLVWLQQALSGRISLSTDAAPADAWQALSNDFGTPSWHWPEGKALPETLKLASVSGSPNRTAILDYEAIDDNSSTATLPVRLQRTLYRLDRSGEGEASGYLLTEIDPARDGLSTDALYLDQIVLQSDTPQHYGLLEVALPPGGNIEKGTWGIRLAGKGKDNLEAIPASQAEEQTDRYGVPVELLNGTVVVRHLLRVAQNGSFQLPPTRFYRMYQPQFKAYEDQQSARWVVR